MRTLKMTVRQIFEACGYKIKRLPYRRTAHPSYEEVCPYATYAPWRSDEEFKAIHKAVKDHTLNDVYRLWGLWTLVGQSAKIEGALIEVGVWRGGSGALIARKARLCGISSPVYLCDTFSGVVKAGDRDPDYYGGEHADTSRAIVEQLVLDLNLTSVHILEGVFPNDTKNALEASNTKFRLCHIDVDTYRSAKDIVDWIWPRMTRGGLIVFDDYGFETCKGVTDYVNELMGEKDRLLIHNLDGHAILIKLNDSKPDPSRL